MRCVTVYVNHDITGFIVHSGARVGVEVGQEVVDNGVRFSVGLD